jgi:hypothetical protein
MTGVEAQRSKGGRFPYIFPMLAVKYQESGHSCWALQVGTAGLGVALLLCLAPATCAAWLAAGGLPPLIGTPTG